MSGGGEPPPAHAGRLATDTVLERVRAEEGRDVPRASDDKDPTGNPDLLGSVREAIRGKYDILGDVQQTDDGAFVFRGRAIASDRVVALSLKKHGISHEGPAQHALSVTQVIEPPGAKVESADPGPPTR